MIGIKLIPFNNEINHVKLGPTKAIYYASKEVVFVCVVLFRLLVFLYMIGAVVYVFLCFR